MVELKQAVIKKIENYVQKNEKHYLNILKELIRIPSISAYEDPEPRYQIIEYVNNSMAENGSGFKSSGLSFMADIISTSNAIDLATNFSAVGTLNNQNISVFINNSRGIDGGYRSNPYSISTSDSESTFYGIKAFLGMNMTYLAIDLNPGFYGYFNTLYNQIDGGFAPLLGNSSDTQSTYYALASIDTLGINYPLFFNANLTLEFILNSSTLFTHFCAGGLVGIDI